MCTSYKLFVARESRKHFLTLLSEMENGPASNFKTIKEEALNPCRFKNDNKLFERAVSVEALTRAWYMIKSKPGSLEDRRAQEEAERRAGKAVQSFNTPTFYTEVMRMTEAEKAEIMQKKAKFSNTEEYAKKKVREAADRALANMDKSKKD